MRCPREGGGRQQAGWQCDDDNHDIMMVLSGNHTYLPTSSLLPLLRLTLSCPAGRNRGLAYKAFVMGREEKEEEEETSGLWGAGKTMIRRGERGRG